MQKLYIVIAFTEKKVSMSNRLIIHFAHANGFPARSYTKIFNLLEKDFDINFIEQHGHSPKFPVSDGWQHLADELQTEIEATYSQPIIGIGHSLGGILHFMVACRKPELYQQIILLDAPIISRLSSFGLLVGKKIGIIDRFSPSKITRTRRNFWQTKDEAFEHYRIKPKFAVFDEQCLRDYVNYGTTETAKGFTLSFKPEIEAHIYRTIPHNLSKYQNRLKTPTTYLGGKNSREAKLARLSFMQNNFPIKTQFTDGTHLFPFEYPNQTANLVKQIIQQNQ
jgi:pimeloyl-ACP methyl ester carboxylesterase